MSAAARWTARPAIVVERLAPVERSYGVKRVSAPRTVTCSGSTPISSAAICANAVRGPWPISVVPTRTTTRPSASSRQTALETGCAPAASSPTETPRPTSGAFSSPQPTAAATFSTSPTRSASSGLPPARTSSPGVQQVLAAHLERVEPGAPRDLVDLRLADPLQVRRAEGAVGAGRREVRVDARRVDAVGRPAVRARARRRRAVATTRGPLSA